MPNLGRAALWYARHGWRVFPVRRRAKLPLIKGWPDLATTDAAQVDRWWGDRPDANIGLACGAASGVYVLDVDQHGTDGEVALAAAVDGLGPLPATVEQRTGSGGRQLFFAWPEGRDLRNKAGSSRASASGFNPGPGLDTRGQGGFVVLPPSLHPCGEAYRWTAGPHVHPPSRLPERWAKALERRAPVTIRVPIRPFRVAGDDAAVARIAGLVARQGEGNRNAALYWAGRKLGELRALGLVRDPSDGDLLRAAVAAGLDEREARATLASARRAGGGR